MNEHERKVENGGWAGAKGAGLWSLICNIDVNTAANLKFSTVCNMLLEVNMQYWTAQGAYAD